MEVIKKGSCLLSAILFFLTLQAQNNLLNFKSYSSKDGLSSGAVNDIIKDSIGFIWLATEDGLNRFDGSNFKIYRHDPTNPSSLKDNHITALYESKDGFIWIGTAGGGVSYYDRSKDSIFSFVTKTSEQNIDAVTSINGDRAGNVWVTGYSGIYCINPSTKETLISNKYDVVKRALEGKVSLTFYQDRKENIWIGTNEGLFKYSFQTKQLSVFKKQQSDTSSIAGNDIQKIVEDEQGTIWIATRAGLSKFLPDNKTFKNYYQDTKGLQLSSNRIYTMKADGKNRLWIGTEEGLDILDIPTNTISSNTPDSRNTRSISNRSIRSILVDKEGIYWVGTFSGGVNKYNENFNYFNLKEYIPFDPLGLRSPIVTSFAPYQNNVFVGTDGGGLHLYDRKSGLFSHIDLPIQTKNDKHGLSILALEMARNGHLWVGTYRNGLYSYNPQTNAKTLYAQGELSTNLSSDEIFCVKEDRNGHIWVGTNGGGINVVKPGVADIDKYVANPTQPGKNASPSSNFIRCFEEDKTGQMWVGTYGAGISVYNPLNQQFSYYNKANSGLPSNYILTILEDKSGNIWVGTSGNGIGLLKKGSSQFAVLTEKDGLANGNIHTIIEDSAGKLWMSTNSGISSFDPVSRKFKNYSSNDGLQAGSFILQSGIQLQDNELFFGGQNGFNHFNPLTLKTNLKIPRVVLTGLKIDNQIVSPAPGVAIEEAILLAKKIQLEYKQAFSISFEALDFTVPEANLYEYMLKGFDKNWVSAGKEHSAYYANIPPGEYTFIVRASNNDGVWNQEGRSLQIIVAPPWWRTTYAYVFYFLVIAGLLYLIRRRGIQKIQMQYAIEQERKEAKMQIERERHEAEYLHKLDQVKIKFLTNLSHEFRTPISLIMGPVDTLIGHIKEETLLNQLNLIKRNSRRLLNLVNQLLDFRKMEERELKLQCNEGDFIQFVKDICDSFNDLAQRKKIEFGFYSEINSLPVLFDHDKAERILFNLLSNAFKFTSENGNIAVLLQESDSASLPNFSSVAISIKDSGIGIPKEAQSHIFNSFFQHETGSEILNHGTGIGLSITKEFVELHGGTISVESEEGKGSTFTFTLNFEKTSPIQQLPQQELLPVSIKVEEKNTPATVTQQPSLLIVEDDEDFRFYIKENLKSLYRIYEAPNGKDGWQRALFHHPDIIVCDVQMPVMNGLELVQKLKADKRTKHIPLILLTAANMPNGTLDGLESGAIDYMTKPFDFAVLQAKIHNILLLNQSYKDTYSKQVTMSLPETEIVSEKDKFLQKTFSYIYENIDNPQLSVEILSTHMCISRASLYNKLLEYTGMSPVEFIRSVKLEKAKELLEKSDMTVSEIAYETGFANPNYFTKVFKTKYNMTPSEYQAEVRKK